MKNIVFKTHSQIYEKHLPNRKIAIFTKVNNYKCGELDPQTSTFTSNRRTYKNVMKMFNALGLNEEILTQYDFEFIVIPFNGNNLITYREKWLREGIKSPWCNDSVDSQILLPIEKINMEGYQEKKAVYEELTLFSEVSNG